MPCPEREMTADEFNAAQERLGLSRRAFCTRLGIARESGNSYALGRKPVPRTVWLAILALEAGLDLPDTDDKPKGAA